MDFIKRPSLYDLGHFCAIYCVPDTRIPLPKDAKEAEMSRLINGGPAINKSSMTRD
jgi:hypothetical protein